MPGCYKRGVHDGEGEDLQRGPRGGVLRRRGGGQLVAIYNISKVENFETLHF